MTHDRVRANADTPIEIKGVLLDAYNEIQRAAAQLMAQYEIEEEEHGFPFNFALREAHREMKAVLRKHAGNEASDGR